MKAVYASIILFSVLIISIIFSIGYLNKTCDELSNIDINMENAIKNDSWEKAETFSKRFTNKWEKTSNEISVYVNHKEMDNINVELWKLTQYVKCQNKDESLASVHTIIFFIDHIKNMEKVNIQNIF